MECFGNDSWRGSHLGINDRAILITTALRLPQSKLEMTSEGAAGQLSIVNLIAPPDP